MDLVYLTTFSPYIWFILIFNEWHNSGKPKASKKEHQKKDSFDKKNVSVVYRTFCSIDTCMYKDTCCTPKTIKNKTSICFVHVDRQGHTSIAALIKCYISCPSSMLWYYEWDPSLYLAAALMETPSDIKWFMRGLTPGHAGALHTYILMSYMYTCQCLAFQNMRGLHDLTPTTLLFTAKLLHVKK